MATELPRKGRLKGVNQARQPIVVDCAESAANAGVTPAARGRLAGVSESRPATVVDCGQAEIPAEVQLKLHLTASLTDADQIALAADIFSLIQVLSDAERELGGGGLTLTDQRAEPGAVILTLRHTVATGAAERAGKLAAMLKRVVAEAKVEAADVSKLLHTAARSSADRVNLLLAGSRTVSRCEVLTVAV